MPLNVFNVLADAGVSVFGSSPEAMTAGFISCHLVIFFSIFLFNVLNSFFYYKKMAFLTFLRQPLLTKFW